MKRPLLIVLAALMLSGLGLAIAATEDGDSEGRTYEIAFDNAFGLSEGGDFKVAGVRAGTTERPARERGAAQTRDRDGEGHGARLRRSPARCALRDPAPVVHRRVLRGLRARVFARADPGRGNGPARADQLDDPARPGQQHRPAPVRGPPPPHHRRARRRPGRQAGRPERGAEARPSRPARDEPDPADPGKADAHDRAGDRRRRHGGRGAGAAAARRGAVRARGGLDRRGRGHSPRRPGRLVRPAPGVPGRARSLHAPSSDSSPRHSSPSCGTCAAPPATWTLS